MALVGARMHCNQLITLQPSPRDRVFRVQHLPCHSTAPYLSLSSSVAANIHYRVRAASSVHTSKNFARLRRSENAAGEFFVDHTCIDCDTCRWMAPGSFTRVGEQSAVYNQPATPNDRVAALQALLSCPTASIHTEKPAADILQIHSTFPIPVDEENIPGVYHCGYHSEKSYGAASYFITRPDGNILVDSPKYTERLARRIEEMGGIRYMFLTHKDDVADHDRWQKRFQCPRILHKEEVRANTAEVEIKLEGSGPWDFLGRDIDLVFTPGHTEACVCLHYKPCRALFTGDHLGKSQEDPKLYIDREHNWYSVDMQLASVRELLSLDFVWILPGHGRRMKFKDAGEKNAALEELLEREEQLSSRM